MIDYKSMYFILCQACSNAVDMLHDYSHSIHNVEEVCNLLISAMNKAEDIYIDTCADESDPNDT